MVARIKSEGVISDQLADSRFRETNEHKVVGCLSFADYDLVTHDTVAFALVYVGYTHLFRALPTKEYLFAS